MTFHGIARAICTCRTTAPWLMVFAGCFLLLTFASMAGGVELIGDNVCQREERYTVNVTEYVLRNVTVRSFKWCMQVPPRCSTFAHRIVNDSRIVEKEKFRQISICCDGYLPNPDGTKCESICKVKCAHGQCNEENKCYCDPGFRGAYCETRCDSNRWGRFCRYHCECERGDCNPELGSCICPPGWTGPRCNKQCDAGNFGPNCSQNCTCHPDQICSPPDGACTNRLKMAVLKKYHTFDAPYLNTTKITNTKKIDMYLLTTPKTKTPATLKTTTLPNKVTKQFIEVTTEGDTVTSERYPVRDAIDVQDVKEVNIKSMNRKVTKSAPTKGKAYFASASVDSRETSSEVVTNVANIDTRAILNASAEASNHNSYGFATISFLCIVVVLCVGFFIATRFLKLTQQEKEAAQLRTSVTKAKSIFHTPLPEPPQSPFFETPPCAHYHSRIGDNDVAINPRLSFSSIRTSRSHYLSYIDESVEPIETEELSDVFYDQLPSTRGTYKATGAPEPPPPPPPPLPLAGGLQLIPQTCAGGVQTRNLQGCNEANKACVSGTSSLALPGLREIREQQLQQEQKLLETHKQATDRKQEMLEEELGGENLYDEIPCWTRSAENDALYINTRAENKTQF